MGSSRKTTNSLPTTRFGTFSAKNKVFIFCPVSTVNRTPAQQADMPPLLWLHLYRQAQITILVVLAKHRIAPWWWFLR